MAVCFVRDLLSQADESEAMLLLPFSSSRSSSSSSSSSKAAQAEVAFPLRTEAKLEEEEDPLFPDLRSKTSSASSFMTNDRITIHKGIKN